MRDTTAGPTPNPRYVVSSASMSITCNELLHTREGCVCVCVCVFVCVCVCLCCVCTMHAEGNGLEAIHAREYARMACLLMTWGGGFLWNGFLYLPLMSVTGVVNHTYMPSVLRRECCHLMHSSLMSYIFTVTSCLSQQSTFLLSCSKISVQVT